LRYIDTGLDRPRWRATLTFRLHQRLQIGVEANPVVGEVVPLATLFLLTEGETRPALFLGTSSDRVGSPEGTQAFYLTFAKYLPLLRLSPYVSLNYSEWDAGWNVPFGASLELGGGFYLRPMYDGHKSHLVGGVFRERWGFGLLWVWYETSGVFVSFGF